MYEIQVSPYVCAHCSHVHSDPKKCLEHELEHQFDQRRTATRTLVKSTTPIAEEPPTHRAMDVEFSPTAAVKVKPICRSNAVEHSPTACAGSSKIDSDWPTREYSPTACSPSLERITPPPFSIVLPGTSPSHNQPPPTLTAVKNEVTDDDEMSGQSADDLADGQKPAISVTTEDPPTAPSTSTPKFGVIRPAGMSKFQMSPRSTYKPIQRRHRCELCDEAFVKAYELEIHRRWHTGERPFTCNMCDVKFISRSDMRRHKKTHVNEKPFQCRHCKQAFKSHPARAYHEKSHSKRGTFRCKYCDAYFVQQSTRNLHAEQCEERVSTDSDSDGLNLD